MKQPYLGIITFSTALLLAQLVACASRTVGSQADLHFVRPRMLSCPQPQRPSDYAFASRQDSVVLEFMVDTAGHPEPNTIVVVRTTDATLNHDAKQVAARCRFQPAVHNGQPIRVSVNMPVIWLSSSR